MQSPGSDLLEVRMMGLSKNITTEALGEFLGKGEVRVRGILLHPQTKGPFQWAQVWVTTESEVIQLLELRDVLAVNGITINRAIPQQSFSTPPQTSWDILSQLGRATRSPTTPSIPSSPFVSTPYPQTPFGLQALSSPFFPRQEQSLPRNLYVLNLPLDLTQVEFKNLFTNIGVVEHSILLSQLDGLGRRRGFVLMSSHREAVEAMHQMHGKWIDGTKLDVSWALVQREAKNMLNNEAELRLSLTGGSLPNRVVHPPSVSIRRDTSPDCSVIVENLDSFLFPDTDTVSSIFKTFGAVARVVKLTDTPLSVLIQFENAVSATALINANGLQLGDRVLKTRPFAPPPPTPGGFDPFAEASRRWLDEATFKAATILPQTPLSLPPRTRLNADSTPFVPNSKADESPLAHAGKMIGKMKAALASHVISLDSDSSDSGKESEHSAPSPSKIKLEKTIVEEKAS